jgi:hypothetical protein
MPFMRTTDRFAVRHRVLPAVITAVVLGAATFAMDFLMDRYGIAASKTLLNDIAIGVLGGLAVFLYLGASLAHERYEFAKERMKMIGEINWRVREALSVIAVSAMFEDRHARLRGIDEATDLIDSILSDFGAKKKSDDPKIAL